MGVLNLKTEADILGYDIIPTGKAYNKNLSVGLAYLFSGKSVSEKKVRTPSLRSISISQVKITYGPKAAVNIANLHANDENDYKSKIGGQVGGIVNFQINDYFGIRPEFVYSNVGTNSYTPTITSYFNSDYGETIYYTKYNLNYLSLPINFVGQIPINEKLKLQAFAGPYMALLLGGKVRTEERTNYNGVKFVNPHTYRVKDLNLNRFDWGVNFGLGFQLNSFVFSTSYSIGLLQVTADNDLLGYNSLPLNQTYNGNLSFGVAYLFGNKKK